ncbi:hypothetical protein Bca101_062936 [Brassica carinata]
MHPIYDCLLSQLDIKTSFAFSYLHSQVRRRNKSESFDFRSSQKFQTPKRKSEGRNAPAKS